jgi:hypothetical protein
MLAAYREIVSFMVKGKTPEEIIAFRPSAKTQARVEDLLHRQQDEGLTDDEAAELRQHVEIEHFMRLAKARARLRLSKRRR